MGKIQKLESLGVAFTENMGLDITPNYEYFGVSPINTPYGKRINAIDTATVQTNIKNEFVLRSGVFTILGKTFIDNLSSGTIVEIPETINLPYWKYTVTHTYVRFVMGDNDANVNTGNISSVGVMKDGVNSFAIIGDGVNVKVYINGIQIGTSYPFTGSFDGLKTLSDDGTRLVNLECWSSDIIIDSKVWSEEDIMEYHYDNLFDTGIHVGTSLELDNTTVILDKGYKGVTGTVVEETYDTLAVVNTPVGHGLEWAASQSRIIMDDPVIPQGDFSISFWMDQSYSQNTSRAIMSNRNGTSTGFTINAANNDTAFRIKHFIGTETTFTKGIGDFNVGEFNHVIITLRVFEGDSYINSYINGDIVGGEVVVAGFINDTLPDRNLELFNSAEAGVYNFKGIISKIKVFDKALTPIQITDLHKRDLTERIH